MFAPLLTDTIPLPREIRRGLWYALVIQGVVDGVVFFVLSITGWTMVLSHIVGFLAGVTAACVWWLRPLASTGKAGGTGHPWRFSFVFLTIAFAVLFLRGGLLAMMTQAWGWPAKVAVAPLAAVSALIFFLALRRVLIPWFNWRDDSAQWWPTAAVAVIVYLGLLRLIYIGLPDLITEEAYYWNYGRHLAPGYLDHPPMVAWLIRLGTFLFGNNEFGVRIGAWGCWLVAAFFGFKLARDMYGRETAVRSILLLSALTFFFAAGCLMMPDAPVTACWAGALYFLYRALVKGETSAWLGAGVCLGLGLLSKYSIGLLMGATFLFMLVDRRARTFLARLHPYLALALALAIFSPVIYWNATHEWVSFAFQTTRRISAATHFSPHILLGMMLILITPTGFAAAIAALFRRRENIMMENHAEPDADKRRLRFIRIFTLAPMAVFVIFSLNHEPKLNWTGPVWLAVLPLMAWSMRPSDTGKDAAGMRLIRRCWMPTIAVLILIYGGAFHYLVLGFPGAGYPGNMSDIAGWSQLQVRINQVRLAVKQETGKTPLVVGMDLYNISSEMAFYGYPEGPGMTAGRRLFGESSLMYDYWFPPAEQTGKNVIVIGRNEGQVTNGAVTGHFKTLSPVSEIPIKLNGVNIGRFFYRVGYDYKPPQP